MAPISTEHRTYIRFLADSGMKARRIHATLVQRGITRISVSGIQHLLNKLRRFHTITDLARTGRPRRVRLEPNIDRVKTFIQEKRGLVSYTMLARHLRISRTSLTRILKHDLEMRCYKPVRTQALSEGAIQKRFDQSKIILEKYVADLDRIIFSDETYFSLGEHIHPQNKRIWTTLKKKIQIPVDLLTAPTALFPEKVMVWCGVSQRGKLPLIFFPPGLRLNARGYQRRVLMQSIPEMHGLYPGTPFIFQQDGAPSHTARTTRRYLANKHIILMEEYPPSSPDLSPLDYSIFGILKQRIYGDPAPRTIDELKDRIRLEWTQLPMSFIIKAIRQFPRRLEMIIAARGQVIQHRIDTLKR